MVAFQYSEVQYDAVLYSVVQHCCAVHFSVPVLCCALHFSSALMCIVLQQCCAVHCIAAVLCMADRSFKGHATAPAIYWMVNIGKPIYRKNYATAPAIHWIENIGKSIYRKSHATASAIYWIGNIGKPKYTNSSSPLWFHIHSYHSRATFISLNRRSLPWICEHKHCYCCRLIQCMENNHCSEDTVKKRVIQKVIF